MTNLQSIAQNDHNYRQGLLLGFTMAEIILLIIFALLLVLSTILHKSESANKDLTKELQSTEQRNQALEEKNQALELALKKAIGNDFDADFMALIDAEKAAMKIAKLEVQLEKIKKENKALASKVAATDALANAMQKGGIDPSSPEEIMNFAGIMKTAMTEAGFDKDSFKHVAENNSRLENDNTNLQGQIEYLKRMCENKGNGLECPPCWADSKGKPEYIFDVALTSVGLIIHDRKLTHRQQEQEKLPLGDLIYDTEITPQSFSDQLLPLFLHSQQKDCRFFVRAYDLTGADEKSIYKKHMRALETRFYKYEVRDETFPSPNLQENTSVSGYATN